MTLLVLGLTAGAAGRCRRAEAGRLLRVPPAGGLQARHQDQQPAAPRPRRRQGRRHRRRQQRPVADRPAAEQQEARRRGGRGAPQKEAEPGRQRPPDAAGQRAGQQGGRQPPGRRLQRRRQARPGLLRHPGRAGRSSTTRATGSSASAKRINTGDAVESGTALTVGDLEPRRPRRPGPARHRTSSCSSTRAKGASSASPSGCRTPPSNPRMVKRRRPRRRRRRRPGDPRRRHRRPDPRPVLGRGGQARPRAAVLRRAAPSRSPSRQVDGKPGSELLTIESQSGRARVLTLDEADDDEPAKRGRLIFYPLPPGNDAGPVARPRRPRRRRQGRRRGDRPGQRPVPGLPPGGPDGPGREPELPRPGRRPDRPAGRPRRRRQGRGLSSSPSRRSRSAGASSRTAG